MMNLVIYIKGKFHDAGSFDFTELMIKNNEFSCYWIINQDKSFTMKLENVPYTNKGFMHLLQEHGKELEKNVWYLDLGAADTKELNELYDDILCGVLMKRKI